VVDPHFFTTKEIIETMEFLVDNPQHAYYKLPKTNLEQKAKLIEYIVKVGNVIVQQDKTRVQ